MPLNFNAIATIVTGLVEGAKMVSPHLGKPTPAPKPRPAAPASDMRPDLTPRVVAIEERQAEQEALLHGIAEQLENVAVAGARLNRHVRILFVVSGASLVISIGTLILLLVQG